MTELVRSHTDLDDDDVAWLQLIQADWQIIADLSFADLVLWLPDREGRGFWAAGQMRPTTGPFPRQREPSVFLRGHVATRAHQMCNSSLPFVLPPSIWRCASAASSSANVRSIATFNFPSRYAANTSLARPLISSAVCR